MTPVPRETPLENALEASPFSSARETVSPLSPSHPRGSSCPARHSALSLVAPMPEVSPAAPSHRLLGNSTTPHAQMSGFPIYISPLHPKGLPWGLGR